MGPEQMLWLHRKGDFTHIFVHLLGRIDTVSILVVGSLQLGCGSLALLAVRLSNPRLRGLGWLGAAFVSGALGAVVLTSSERAPHLVSSLGSDLFVLLSVVLLHVAVLELRQAESLFPRFGAVLMLIHTSVCCLITQGYILKDVRIRVMLLGVLVASQLIQTAVLLIRGGRYEVRTPTWFTALLLLSLMGINVFRSGVLLFSKTFREMGHASELRALTIMAYVATGMGLAFGFFWMTTSELSLELEQMANTDPLTRLYNRRIFREWCEREMARSRRTDVPFSLMMMDLDHFKGINDRFGHHGGDEMLCAAVERMQDSVRGIDILGRWGGEEFVAILPGASPEAALLVAERVRKNIERLRLPVSLTAPDQTMEWMRLTVSLGITTFQGGGDSLAAMFQRADEALYRAKASGRNQVVTGTLERLKQTVVGADGGKEIELGCSDTMLA